MKAKRKPIPTNMPFATPAAIALVVLAFALVPFVANRAVVSMFYVVLYFVLLAGSWNIISGFTGYINFGHVAFVGLGMYSGSIAIVDYGVYWPLAIVFGGICAGLFAALVSFPLLRVKGPYFTITTLAIAEAVRVIISSPYLEPITRAGSGIPIFVRIDMGSKYLIMLILVLLTVTITYLIATRPMGLKLLAIREDERAAETLGIHTTQLKITVFVISAFLAGMGGAVHATYLSYIDPLNAFHIQFTVIPIVMTFFGGFGTVLGPVLGGVSLQLLNDYVWANVLRLNMAVFGFLMVLLILFLPQGVLNWAKENGYLPKTRKT